MPLGRVDLPVPPHPPRFPPPPGPLLAEVHVAGIDCVPWSVPRTIRVRGAHIHLKDEGLIAWQDAIRDAAGRAYPGDPYTGPVLVAATFRRLTRDRSLWGTPWFAGNRRLRGGDLTNYWKAAEDAIATRTARKRPGEIAAAVYPGVIANDSQVVAGIIRKVWGPTSGVDLRIFAVTTAFPTLGCEHLWSPPSETCREGDRT